MKCAEAAHYLSTRSQSQRAAQRVGRQRQERMQRREVHAAGAAAHEQTPVDENIDQWRLEPALIPDCSSTGGVARRRTLSSGWGSGLGRPRGICLLQWDAHALTHSSSRIVLYSICFIWCYEPKTKPTPNRGQDDANAIVHDLNCPGQRIEKNCFASSNNEATFLRMCRHRRLYSYIST